MSRNWATVIEPLGTPSESFPLASVMPVCKHSVVTLGLGGNRLPYAYAQRQRRRRLPFGLLRSPNRSGSAMPTQAWSLLSPWAVVTDDEEKSANEALPEKFILKIVDVRDNFFC